MIEDLGFAFADFGVNVQGPSYSGLGILDMPDQIVGEVMISTEYVLTVKTADFTTAKHGDQLTISAANYRIKEKKKIDDGALSKITLSKL